MTTSHHIYAGVCLHKNHYGLIRLSAVDRTDGIETIQAQTFVYPDQLLNSLPSVSESISNALNDLKEEEPTPIPSYPDLGLTYVADFLILDVEGNSYTTSDFDHLRQLSILAIRRRGQRYANEFPPDP